MAAAGGTTPAPEEGGEGETPPPEAPETAAGDASGPAEQGTGDSETG